MKVVLDVNVLLSALIKDSTTRDVLVKADLEFYFPEASLHKIRKYEEYILEKSGLSKEEYEKILNNLFKKIKLISNEDIKMQWQEAKKIMEHIDEEDVIFIATALSLPNSIVWSHDKDFQKQEKIITLTTEQIIRRGEE